MTRPILEAKQYDWRFGGSGSHFRIRQDEAGRIRFEEEGVRGSWKEISCDAFPASQLRWAMWRLHETKVTAAISRGPWTTRAAYFSLGALTAGALAWLATIAFGA